ncbi:hypothetical protein L596_017687 [Steinernema carpocapsae]|uniref:F-box domain-containing protein n=1 Tax=Steinernema carpocapsae TaxID=34508 RepID=A0A4U5N2Q7_STECR|nr:hypothetical protein L596_017687 [Steinernema carpocapsae]
MDSVPITSVESVIARSSFSELCSLRLTSENFGKVASSHHDNNGILHLDYVRDSLPRFKFDRNMVTIHNPRCGLKRDMRDDLVDEEAFDCAVSKSKFCHNTEVSFTNGLFSLERGFGGRLERFINAKEKGEAILKTSQEYTFQAKGKRKEKKAIEDCIDEMLISDDDGVRDVLVATFSWNAIDHVYFQHGFAPMPSFDHANVDALQEDPSENQEFGSFRDPRYLGSLTV